MTPPRLTASEYLGFPFRPERCAWSTLPPSGCQEPLGGSEATGSPGAGSSAAHVSSICNSHFRCLSYSPLLYSVSFLP